MFNNQLTKLLKCNNLFFSVSLSWLVVHYGAWYKSVDPSPTGNSGAALEAWGDSGCKHMLFPRAPLLLTCCQGCLSLMGHFPELFSLDFRAELSMSSD